MPRLSDLIARKSQAEMTLADLMRPATVNPLMAAKAQRQEQAIPRVSLAEIMNYPQTWQQFGDNIQANYPIDSQVAVRQAAFEMAKNAGPLMTVWQGSPHRFAPTGRNPLGEFDASKIGTGEGAQAYGYGHYLAEAPDVAKTYMQGSKPTVKHQVIDGRVRIVDVPPEKGNLYKVDLPDEHIGKMLDWDKPLSQQPESVRKAIGKIQGEVTGPFRDSMTGDEILRHIQATLKGVGRGSEKAESLLRDAGIPGIRYLDGGSRAGGQGTSNFVVFPGNEGILKILGRE